MGSLRESFQSEMSSVKDGIWIELSANPNKDAVIETSEFGEETIKVPATIPRFKVSRWAHQNKDFSKYVRKHHEAALKKYGVISIDKLTEEQMEDVNLEIFLDACLKSWEHFQPYKDGEDFAYSKENAKLIMSDLAWWNLYHKIRGEAMIQDNYSKELADAAAKN